MDFFDTLVRFETALWNTIERELLQTGQVGLGTLTALRVLHRHNGSGRVQDLSRELSLTIGAASKLADRLERDGLAVRRPHPTDRRSSLLSLTETGEGARVGGEEVLGLVLAQVLDGDADAATATSAIQRLQLRLDARS
jgi:DNA-binding MarR family transcriptional regulator